MSDVLSTHKVEICPVVVEKHPNADTLGVVKIYGYSCVVKISDWKEGMLGAYIPPDSLVDTTRPEFIFLTKPGEQFIRIRAKKLRGIQSFGLLIPAPENTKIGDNVAGQLGVTHYEPPELTTGGQSEKAPPHLSGLSAFDVDSMRRYNSILQEGEPVIVTEKIHGASSRYCFTDGRIYVGSRNEWKKYDPKNMFWKALYPELEQFCKDHKGFIVYGEVYGEVKGFRYGCTKGQVKFAAFDLLTPDHHWENAKATRLLLQSVSQVPLLGEIPFSFDAVCALAEGASTMLGADHIREGCVVKPLIERWNEEIGRVCLKVVGAGYLEKK